MAKELGVNEQQLKKIEHSVDETYDKIKELLPKKKSSVDPKDIKDQIVKQHMVERYFVWGKVRPFILDGYNIKGLFGYLWLHGGVVHLLGNLLFLWIFGNAVCAKIGNVAYLPIYIMLGILAGIGHLAFQGGPL